MSSMKNCIGSFAGLISLAFISANAAPVIDSPYDFPFYTGKILPTPHEVSYHPRIAPLNDTAVLLGAGLAPGDARLRELRGRIEAYGGKIKIVKTLDESDSTLIILGAHSEAVPLLKGKNPPDKPEGYLIEPAEQAGRMVVCLQGSDDFGLLWAVMSLNQLITADDGKPV